MQQRLEARLGPGRAEERRDAPGLLQRVQRAGLDVPDELREELPGRRREEALQRVVVDVEAHPLRASRASKRQAELDHRELQLTAASGDASDLRLPAATGRASHASHHSCDSRVSINLHLQADC